MYSTYRKVLFRLGIGRATMLFLFSITPAFERILIPFVLKSFWRSLSDVTRTAEKSKKSVESESKSSPEMYYWSFQVPWHMTREAWMFFLPGAPNVYFCIRIVHRSRPRIEWQLHLFIMISLYSKCSTSSSRLFMLIIGADCRMATPHRAMSPA